MAIKVGCFRITYQDGRENYIPYNEFYDRDEIYRQQLKASAERGEVTLTCACRECTDLELMITKNNVIRVKANKNQAQHKESCPKSEAYTQWASTHKDGLMNIGEDGRPCFNITVPSGIKSEGNSGGGSSSSSGSGVRQRANIMDLVTSVCNYAWLKQTYSIKKKIKTARSQGLKPDWQYKDFEEFTRLFFGVTADIDVYWQKTLMPLKNICYRADTFYQSDYKLRYLIYAKIEKLSEYKGERKYQYITLRMRSDKSPNKATVRILTEDFNKDTYDALNGLISEGRIIMFAGYAKHDSFKGEDGQLSHWITMINYTFLEAAENGLLLRHEYEKPLVDELCKRRILFKKSLLPLENYGGYLPTAIIEQQKGKDIIIDVCFSGQEYTKRQQYQLNNPEYEVLLYKKKDHPDDIIKDLFEVFRTRASQ